MKRHAVLNALVSLFVLPVAVSSLLLLLTSRTLLAQNAPFPSEDNGLFVPNIPIPPELLIDPDCSICIPPTPIPDPLNDADRLLNQGVDEYRTNQFQSALRSWRQALELYQSSEVRSVLPQESFLGVGRVLGNLGYVYWDLGEYSQAIESFERGIAIFRESSSSSEESHALASLGLLYEEMGQYGQAITLYERQLAIAREEGDYIAEGRALINFGNAYWGLGEYQQAFEFYEQRLAITREIGYGEGDVIAHLGIAYWSLDQYGQAIDFYEQSLAITRESRDRQGEGTLLSNLASVYRDLGQYEQAIDFHEQSLVITRESRNREGEGITLNSLGNVYFALGQYEQAIDFYEQSLVIAREIGDRQGEGNALVNLGNAYGSLGQYQEATALYERSLAIFRENRDRQGEGLTLGNLGNVYYDLDQYQQAMEGYQQALTIAQETGGRSAEGQLLSNIGDLLARQDQPEVAIVFLKQSVNVRESIREEIRELPTKLQQSYTNTVADDYRFLADLLLSQGRVIEAQQVLELLKLEELREFTRNARGLESEQGIALNSVEQRILDEFGTLVAFGKQVYDCEQTRCAQLSAYRQQRQAQSTRFDTQVTAFVQTIRDNRQTDDFFYDPRYLNETAREIVAQPGTLLIYPFVTEDQVWLLYTAAGDVAGAIPVDVTQLELGETVVHFRELLESPYSNLEELQATGKQLYDWLIAPLEPELRANQITTLVFSQDRVTRYIPMAALWDGERYLMQNYTLSTVLSAELTDMSDRLPALPADTSILALGLSASVLDLDPLPYVENELDAIVRVNEADSQGIYPGIELLNGDFDRDALVANLFGHRIVHIATHGSFVAGLPEESFLVLGDGDRFSIPDINSIGSDLRDVHLVVLSACETAVGGPDADGIEVAGISSYFLAANRASAVMASLWLVNDCSTSLLMQQFYENLAQGMTKAEALRTAQRALLESDTRVEDCENRMFVTAPIGDAANPEPPTASVGYAHPYYWAPFILIGNGL